MILFKAILFGLIINFSDGYERIDAEKMKNYLEQLYGYMHSKAISPSSYLDRRTVMQTAVQLQDFHVKVVNGIKLIEMNINLHTFWIATESKLIQSDYNFGSLTLDGSRVWYPDLILQNVRSSKLLSPNRIELRMNYEQSPPSAGNISPETIEYEGSRRRQQVQTETPYFTFTQSLNVEVMCSGSSRLVDQIGIVNCPLIIKQGGNQIFQPELKWTENKECVYNEMVKENNLIHISTGKRHIQSIDESASQQALVLNICTSNWSVVILFLIICLVQSLLTLLLFWILPLGSLISVVVQLFFLFGQIFIFLIINHSDASSELTRFINSYQFYLSVVSGTLITLLCVISYHRACCIMKKKIAQQNRRLLSCICYNTSSNGQNSNNCNDCVLCTSTMNPLSTNANQNNPPSTYNNMSPIGAMGSPGSRIIDSRNSPGPMSLIQNNSNYISSKLDQNYNDGYFLSGSSESGNGTTMGNVLTGPSTRFQCIHRNYEGSDHGSGSKLLKNSTNSMSAFNMISPNCWLVTLRIVLTIIYPLSLVIFWITLFSQSSSPIECQGISTCQAILD